MSRGNGHGDKPPFSIDRWLAEEHFGVRGIWIAMFVAGVILIIIGNIGR